MKYKGLNKTQENSKVNILSSCLNVKVKCSGAELVDFSGVSFSYYEYMSFSSQRLRIEPDLPR